MRWRGQTCHLGISTQIARILKRVATFKELSCHVMTIPYLSHREASVNSHWLVSRFTWGSNWTAAYMCVGELKPASTVATRSVMKEFRNLIWNLIFSTSTWGSNWTDVYKHLSWGVKPVQSSERMPIFLRLGHALQLLKTNNVVSLSINVFSHCIKILRQPNSVYWKGKLWWNVSNVKEAEMAGRVEMTG